MATHLFEKSLRPDLAEQQRVVSCLTSLDALKKTGGAGLLFCFAQN